MKTFLMVVAVVVPLLVFVIGMGAWAGNNTSCTANGHLVTQPMHTSDGETFYVQVCR